MYAAGTVLSFLIHDKVKGVLWSPSGHIMSCGGVVVLKFQGLMRLDG